MKNGPIQTKFFLEEPTGNSEVHLVMIKYPGSDQVPTRGLACTRSWELEVSGWAAWTGHRLFLSWSDLEGRVRARQRR